MRRFTSTQGWKEVEAEISVGLNPGPLPADGPIARLFGDGTAKSLVVQYVTVAEIEASPLDVMASLDAMLVRYGQSDWESSRD